MPVKDAYQVQVSRPVAAELDRRRHVAAESRGVIASRDLERYYELLQAELGTLELSEAEASLICDACNGRRGLSTAPDLVTVVEAAICLDHLDETWGVDGPRLITKLRGLTPGQAFALIDAVERYWLAALERYWLDAPDRNQPDPLAAVGLVRNQNQRT